MPVPLIVWGLFALGASAGLDACLPATPKEEKNRSDRNANTRCGECHQNPNDPGGSWKGVLGGLSNASEARQKALAELHRRHTKEASLITKEIGCNDCHDHIEKFDDPRHFENRDRAEVYFAPGGRADTGKATPSYDSKAGTCSNIACHGADRVWGKPDTPSWFQIALQGATNCAACHTDPPPPPQHQVQNLKLEDCHLCHDKTMAADGTIADKNFHINGNVDVLSKKQICTQCHAQPPTPAQDPKHPQNRTDCESCHTNLAPRDADGNLTFLDPMQHNNPAKKPNLLASPEICTKCHGSEKEDQPQENWPAPPMDTKGNTDTASPGVGAHQKHLNSLLTTNIACTSCHPHYETIDSDPRHRDGTDTLVFEGGMGIANGVMATFDPVTVSCTNYCHGATLSGGKRTQWIWTSVSTGPTACNSCHGTPPDNHSPLQTECSLCHAVAGKAEDGTQVIAQPDLHINGLIDTE